MIFVQTIHTHTHARAHTHTHTHTHTHIYIYIYITCDIIYIEYIQATCEDTYKYFYGYYLQCCKVIYT